MGLLRTSAPPWPRPPGRCRPEAETLGASAPRRGSAGAAACPRGRRRRAADCRDSARTPAATRSGWLQKMVMVGGAVGGLRRVEEARPRALHERRRLRAHGAADRLVQPSRSPSGRGAGPRPRRWRPRCASRRARSAPTRRAWAPPARLGIALVDRAARTRARSRRSRRVPLVHHQDQRPAALPGVAGDARVLLGHALDGVDDQQRRPRRARGRAARARRWRARDAAARAAGGARRRCRRAGTRARRGVTGVSSASRVVPGTALTIARS